MFFDRSDFVRDSEGFEIPDLHSSSAEYANRFSGKVGRWLLEVQNRATESLLQNQTIGSALDVGGGHGQNLDLLIRKGANVTVTGSSSSCTSLIAPYIKNGIVNFKVAPLTKLPYTDRSFDIVLSYRMITHLQAWREHVSELCRVSQDSVLIEFPVRRGFNSLSGLMFGAKKGIEGNTRPYTLFREADVKAEFQRKGFGFAGRIPQYFWPMALHRLHGSRMIGILLERVVKLVGLTSIFGSPVIARFRREQQ